jgi:hypothetical protein
VNKYIPRLLQRLFILGVLSTGLFVVSYTGFPANATLVDSCEPCTNCAVNTICTPCWAFARPTDNFCSDGSRMYSCAGVCKPNGSNGCIGDIPICEGTQIAICEGGTWTCDNSPWGPCTTGQPYCPNGAICYGGSWFCANGSGCSGTPPCCDPPNSPQPCSNQAVCESGRWYCS